MAEHKLCPDCGRERTEWRSDHSLGKCWAASGVLDTEHLRLAYAREKAAREKVEADKSRAWAIQQEDERLRYVAETRALAAEARAAKLEELLRETRRFVPRLGIGDLLARIDAALPPEAGGHSPKEKG